MKKHLIRLFAVLTVLPAVLASCEKNGGTDKPDGAPEVTIESYSVVDNTLKFKIKAVNATKAEYVLAVKGETGTAQPVEDMTKETSVPGLEPNKEYKLSVTAYNGDISSFPAEVEFSTAASVKVDVTEAKSTSVKFVMTPMNVNEYEYSFVKKGENPSYEKVSSGEPKEVVKEGLEKSTTYVIDVKAEGIDPVQVEVYTPNSYKKRVAINKFTGTNCSFCPGMTEALEELKSSYPDLIVVANHKFAGDPFNISATDPLYDSCRVDAVPRALFDYEFSVNTNSVKATYTRAANSNHAVAGVSVSSKFENDNINITADLTFDATSEYKVVCLVSEDGLEASGTEPSGIYDHVARAYATPTLGEYLGAVNAGSTMKKEYSISKKMAWKIENMSVVVMVLREKVNSDGQKIFTVVNANTAKVGESSEQEIL